MKYTRKREEVDAIEVDHALLLGWDRMPWWLKDAVSQGVVVERYEYREMKIMQPAHKTCCAKDWLVRTVGGDGEIRGMSAADFSLTYEPSQ